MKVFEVVAALLAMKDQNKELVIAVESEFLDCISIWEDEDAPATVMEIGLDDSTLTGISTEEVDKQLPFT